MSERDELEQAYQLAEGLLATGQYEAASRVVATLLSYDSEPNFHHLRLLLEEIVEAEPVPAAQVSLAMVLLGGESGEVEPERAFGLLQTTVDAEESEPGVSESVVALAHELIADCYITGKGVAPDAGAAYSHLQQAAERGQARAALRLGAAYQEGLLDLPVDLEQARIHLGQAAEAGEAHAYTRLALIELEEGEEAASERAAGLLVRARELGDPDAAEILERLESDLDEGG